ncbi:hypothetical protein V500_01844 [Pseudogymnoascus sp. VKM F-4518 (FW-2643)]|nr:hypothetical protein V500_01844 [Pseudogymnoascus sp. VKM F-4518 (FW-2643)]
MQLTAVTQSLVTAALVLAVAVSAMPAAATVGQSASTTSRSVCSRECMTTIVGKILKSMVAHNPDTLPLAPVYQATENSHPAALGMMTLWRTVTEAGKPSLLAIDTTTGSAYFSLDISEGNDKKQSVLWARIKVVDRAITELELYISRSRGDHGFSFSSEELAANYKQWMSPPAKRNKATRAQLESLSEATFNTNSTFSVSVATDCQFTEVGATVIDAGPDGDGSTTPLGCNWPADRPADAAARANLVIDETTGIVVTGALVPGKVYPYGNISAFIPNDMEAAQEAQDVWYAEKMAEGGFFVALDESSEWQMLLDSTATTALQDRDSQPSRGFLIRQHNAHRRSACKWAASRARPFTATKADRGAEEQDNYTELELKLGKKRVAAPRKAHQPIPLEDRNSIPNLEAEAKAREEAENWARSGSESGSESESGSRSASESSESVNMKIEYEN